MLFNSIQGLSDTMSKVKESEWFWQKEMACLFCFEALGIINLKMTSIQSDIFLGLILSVGHNDRRFTPRDSDFSFYRSFTFYLIYMVL